MPLVLQFQDPRLEEAEYLFSLGEAGAGEFLAAGEARTEILFTVGHCEVLLPLPH